MPRQTLNHWYVSFRGHVSQGCILGNITSMCELTILLLNWVRIWIISKLIGGEGSELTPNGSHLIDTKGPGVGICQ